MCFRWDDCCQAGREGARCWRLVRGRSEIILATAEGGLTGEGMPAESYLRTMKVDVLSRNPIWRA